MSREVKQGLECGYDCGHSEEEHAAFDRGVMEGEEGVGLHDCPYAEESLREAWQTGQSVGALNRQAAQAR